MGADMADIDNDGDNDIFVTEMRPSDYQRLKWVTTFEDWNPKVMSYNEHALRMKYETSLRNTT